TRKTQTSPCNPDRSPTPRDHEASADPCFPPLEQVTRPPTTTLATERSVNESLRTNADDRLSCHSVGRVDGRVGLVEGRDVADVRPQSSVSHPLDNLTQLGPIGLDNEVDRQAVSGPRLRRSDDRHHCSSGADQTRGPLPDLAADHIENQVDAADVLKG